VEQYPAIRYYKEPRGGLSIARNAGLRIATSQLVAFTDDDVSLHPLWLYHVAETFRKPGVYAMTGLVLPAALDTESQQLFEKEWSFNNGYCDRSYDTTYFRGSLAKGPKVWEIGAGANMAFRRGVFETAGLFDERLGAGAAGCSEDSEMWYRILAAGLEIRYNPRAVVYHEHRKELTALFRQLFSYMRGHTAAALIQQQQIQEAGYRRYLYRKLTKSYLPLLVKNVFRHPFRYKMLQIQVRGIFSGVLFYMRNRNKPPQTNLT
jgi:cellulose synthase/poly-beta-1,6-N-acetylglucosamine synthase-like glycosyltransferase